MTENQPTAGCEDHYDTDDALTSGAGIGEPAYCDGTCNPAPAPEPAPMHTHYSPYEPPRQVPGTLLACAPEFPSYHKVEGSELFADYMYSPRFGLPSDTGLSPEMETALIAAYTERRADDVSFRIVDVVGDPEYMYRVRITNRTLCNGDGPDWHTEEWGIGPDEQWRSTYNPHPSYEHQPAFCPNCGH